MAIRALMRPLGENGAAKHCDKHWSFFIWYDFRTPKNIIQTCPDTIQTHPDTNRHTQDALWTHTRHFFLPNYHPLKAVGEKITVEYYARFYFWYSKVPTLLTAGWYFSEQDVRVNWQPLHSLKWASVGIGLPHDEDLHAFYHAPHPCSSMFLDPQNMFYTWSGVPMSYLQQLGQL